MTPEYILKAAITAMLHGNKTPHCYHAWQAGKGYSNDGSLVETRADYLAQLARTAQSEIDNLGWAPAYAEPGYGQPKHGVMLANWNCFPSRIDLILERAGYAVEWSDEWSTCGECNNLFRTSPNGFCWEPAFKEDQDGLLCTACYAEAHPAEEEEEEKTFSVIEHYNGFELQHNATGKTHWLSDGVDVFDDITPGDPDFRQRWEDAFNSNVSETLNAYFPDLTEED